MSCLPDSNSDFPRQGVKPACTRSADVIGCEQPEHNIEHIIVLGQGVDSPRRNIFGKIFANLKTREASNQRRARLLYCSSPQSPNYRYDPLEFAAQLRRQHLARELAIETDHFRRDVGLGDDEFEDEEEEEEQRLLIRTAAPMMSYSGQQLGEKCEQRGNCQVDEEGDRHERIGDEDQTVSKGLDAGMCKCSLTFARRGATQQPDRWFVSSEEYGRIMACNYRTSSSKDATLMKLLYATLMVFIVFIIYNAQMVFYRLKRMPKCCIAQSVSEPSWHNGNSPPTRHNICWW